jgi:hypothetical protein
MRINRQWALPLAMIGGVALGAALTLRQRSARRHAENREHKEDVQAWEAEGGALAVPASPPLAA